MMLKHAKSAVQPAKAARGASVRAHAVVEKKGVRADKAASAAVAASLVAAPAYAETVPVDSTIDTIIAGVKASGEVVKSAVTTIEAGVQVLKEGYDVAAPVVEKAVQTASPVVGSVVKSAVDAAAPAFKAALPSLQDATKALESSTGLNSAAVAEATSAVTATAATAATAATPFITKFLKFLASSDPVTLAEYGLGAAAIVYLSPVVLGALGGSLRGYAGEVAPAAALDSLVNEGSAVLVDVRTAKEKEASGIPDLPSAASGKLLDVEYAVTEDKKLRGQLRDPSAIEAQVTALQIAALKKITKGTKIILLDRYGPAARTVAKELSAKGYGKVFVIAGGFDGRGGWVSSKLQIKPAAVLSSAAPPSIAKTVFTRRALPAPKA